jgi:hypothetical protein
MVMHKLGQIRKSAPIEATTKIQLCEVAIFEYQLNTRCLSDMTESRKKGNESF